MALPDAQLFALAGLFLVLLVNLGVLPLDKNFGGTAALDSNRRLHEDASSDGMCARITDAHLDQLEWHQAKGCLGECYHHFSATTIPIKIALAGVLLVPLLLFVVVMVVARVAPPNKGECCAAVVFMAMFGSFFIVWFDDFTGLFFHKNGTLCLKSLTCTAFGWTPAWVGLGLGFLFGAWSAWQAFNVPLDYEKLREYCGRLPRDDESGEKKKLCLLFPVSLQTAEAFKVNKKFSVAFGDVILDSSGLMNYLRKGQPYYAALTFLCILRAEGSRGFVDDDYTPHSRAVKQLRGWQSDFIVYWRESRALGMVSPAFLYRSTQEFHIETCWTSFIAISALLSSTCTAWFSLGQLLASLASGCLSVVEYAQDMEQSYAEDDVAHMFWKPDTKEYEEVKYVRLIPRADYFARTQILGGRSLGLVKAYRLCEFLSKAVVSTALLHFVPPLLFYLIGLAFAAALWPWRLSTGHKKKLQFLFTWPFPYFMLGNYPLTLPTFQGWLQPDSSSPPITATFLGLLWIVLLAQTARIGWMQAVAAHTTMVWRALRSTTLCETALLQNSTGEWQHFPAHHQGENLCEFELTPSRVHRAVKGGIILLGLLAELGLICTAIRLAILRRKWHEEDEARLIQVARREERILYRELGGGKAETSDEEYERLHRRRRRRGPVETSDEEPAEPRGAQQPGAGEGTSFLP